MQSTRNWPVWLYIPNVIGYLRIVLSIAAFMNWRSPWRFFGYYFTGFVLDAADGLAARKLNQSSEFGAQLDMLTDRCATGALLAVLSALYPDAAWLCFGLIFLDGYSHWLQMVAGMCAGTASHKQASKDKLLTLYYRRSVLTIVCSLNEMCFLMLYMQAFTSGPTLIPGLTFFNFVLYSAFPVCALKQIISVRQIMSAHSLIRESF